METDLFRGSPIGELLAISGRHEGEEFEHFAFLPAVLPKTVSLSSNTWHRVVEAGIALGRLDAAGQRLPNPRLVARPAIRREAVSTSALEGTFTTLPQVLESEALEEDRPSRDVGEVLRFVRTAELGYDLIKERPLSLDFIKTLHALLMKDDPTCPDDEKGVFRKRQNFIGPRRAPITESFFVPPPPGDLLIERMEQWMAWLHLNEEMPVLVRASVGHYQFETLHPFFDGNGRLGRLIVVLQLIESGNLSVPTLEISPYLEDNRDEYQARLRSLSSDGDFDSWVTFFMTAVQTQSERGLKKIDQLMNLKDEMIELLRQRKVRGSAIEIAEELIGNPAVRPADAAQRLGITYQAALHAIERLEEEGILERLRAGGRRRVYVAPKVINVLNAKVRG